MNVSQEEFAEFAALDLEPIKVKLMHQESGEGWSLERANAAEFEYRRFLYLMKKFPQEQAAPSMEVDTFWHYHILDTLKYAEDCQAAFGYFLHHFPYMGLRGEDDLVAHQRVGERMRTLYEETFGQTYPFAAGNGGKKSQGATKAAGTAFSMTPSSTAFSMTPSTTAFSMTPSGPAFPMNASATAFSMSTAQTAFSMSTAGTAFSMSTANTPMSLIRPRLPAQAVN
jgi:hypothetical protein